MPKVKLKVLLNSVKQISAKLHKELGKVKDSDESKDKKQAVLFAHFDIRMEELTLGDVSEQRAEQLVEKINKILDKFEALTKNNNLKSQLIDAFKKRSKSKGEKKVTLKSQTIERLKALCKTQGIKGSYDSSINQLLTLFGAPELLGLANSTTREVSAELESEALQKLVLDEHTAETQSANDSKDAVNAFAVNASKGRAKKKKKKKKR